MYKRYYSDRDNRAFDTEEECRNRYSSLSKEIILMAMPLPPELGNANDTLTLPSIGLGERKIITNPSQTRHDGKRASAQQSGFLMKLIAEITAGMLLIATLSCILVLFTPNRAVAAVYNYTSIALKRSTELLDLASQAGNRNLFCKYVEKARAWSRVATIEAEIDYEAFRTLVDTNARYKLKGNSASSATILQRLKKSVEETRSHYLDIKDIVSSCGTDQ